MSSGPATDQAWEEARALAQTASPTPVERRSAALPFFFQSATSNGILVHKGRIVTERGPTVAGAYLRDLGIIDGKGPPLRDVLYVLTTLDALPTGGDFFNEGYFDAPGNPRLAELTARVEADGTVARVVLHYLLEPPAARRLGLLNGSRDPDMPPPPRPVARCTLTIPREGDASWSREDIEWNDPAR